MQLLQTTSPHTNQRIYIDEAGNKYPSVSRLANQFKSKYGLNMWRKRIGYDEADRILKESQVRGTAIHKLIEDNEYPEDSEYRNYLTHYYNQIAPRLEIKHAELQLGYCSPDGLRFAGTADLIGFWRGRFMIGDFKTSEKEKDPKYCDGYSLQLAAYSCCYEQTYGIDTSLGCIFNLLPDKAVCYEIDLTYPKEFLLDTVLPAFYDYYRIPKCDRPWPDQFIKKEMSAYQRRFSKECIKVADF